MRDNLSRLLLLRGQKGQLEQVLVASYEMRNDISLLFLKIVRFYPSTRVRKCPQRVKLSLFPPTKATNFSI